MDWSWLELQNPVAIWWMFLVTVSLGNMTAWFWSRRFLQQKLTKESDLEARQLVRLLLLASAGYVFGCAFRSFLPRADVQRICLFDTWFSSVMLGRSVATVAELCYVFQWAIAIRYLARKANCPWALTVSSLIVPMIAFAECCSWFAVISTNYLGNSIEESTWGLTYVLIATALIQLFSRFRLGLQVFLGVSIAGCLLYVGFMATVDVPMYVTRLLADLENHKTYFGLAEGLHDLNTHWTVTHSITDWRTEIPWMSLYFSLAVWVSLVLCHLPYSEKKLNHFRRPAKVEPGL